MSLFSPFLSGLCALFPPFSFSPPPLGAALAWCHIALATPALVAGHRHLLSVSVWLFRSSVRPLVPVNVPAPPSAFCLVCFLSSPSAFHSLCPFLSPGQSFVCSLPLLAFPTKLINLAARASRALAPALPAFPALPVCLAPSAVRPPSAGLSPAFSLSLSMFAHPVLLPPRRGAVVLVASLYVCAWGPLGWCGWMYAPCRFDFLLRFASASCVRSPVPTWYPLPFLVVRALPSVPAFVSRSPLAPVLFVVLLALRAATRS